MHVYLVECATACLSGGAGSLRSFYCLSLCLHALPLCALGHNNGSNNGFEVCASSECPDETVHLHKIV